MTEVYVYKYHNNLLHQHFSLLSFLWFLILIIVQDGGGGVVSAFALVNCD